MTDVCIVKWLIQSNSGKENITYVACFKHLP